MFEFSLRVFHLTRYEVSSLVKTGLLILNEMPCIEFSRRRFHFVHPNRMTTSCYLPVFYCFGVFRLVRFFEILLKELSGLFYCLIVNVLCFRLLAVNVLYFITLIRLCQQVF